MSRRWVVLWLILLVIGFGLMSWSYRCSAAARSSFPFRAALLIPRGDQVEKPADAALPVSVRFLPSADPAVALIADALRHQGPDGGRQADAVLVKS